MVPSLGSTAPPHVWASGARTAASSILVAPQLGELGWQIIGLSIGNMFLFVGPMYQYKNKYTHNHTHTHDTCLFLLGAVGWMNGAYVLRCIASETVVGKRLLVNRRGSKVRQTIAGQQPKSLQNHQRQQEYEPS